MAPVGFWPKRGVYFCRESGEQKFDTGVDPRIVRVGTKAPKAAFGTELWTRPLQHKSQPATGSDNHRGSILRESASACLERDVSRIIGNMPFAWLSIEDDAGPQSLRGYIERNSIRIRPGQRRPTEMGHERSGRASVGSGTANYGVIHCASAPQYVGVLTEFKTR